MARPRKSADAQQVPQLWEWLTAQIHNVDPDMRQAARYASERWGFEPGMRWKDIDRALLREGSVHVSGWHALAELYKDTFGLDAAATARAFGKSGSLIYLEASRCTAILRDGLRCGAGGMPGQDKCQRHGGMLLDPEALAATTEAVGQKLVDGAERALSVVLDLMDNARSEKVRLDAALGWLDRAGIGPSVKVDIGVTVAADQASAEVTERLAQLTARALTAVEELDLEAEVVEAEVVE